MKVPTTLSNWLLHRRLRHQSLPVEGYQIRVARTALEYREAFRLLQAAYVVKGMESPTSSPLRISEQHVLGESSVLVARHGDRLVGTMSLTADSPAGLPLDSDSNYPAELEQLRARGARMAEVGSFAIVSRSRGSGIAQLLSLTTFRLAFGCSDRTHLVIGVHPAAQPFYKAAWGFRSLGPHGEHAKLAAPVAAMALSRAEFDKHLRSRDPWRWGTGFDTRQHVDGADHPCWDLPPVENEAQLHQWSRVPMQTFRVLFEQESDRLATLSQRVFDYAFASGVLPSGIEA